MGRDYRFSSKEADQQAADLNPTYSNERTALQDKIPAGETGKESIALTGFSEWLCL